jgi:hypothetical protein
MNSSEKSKRKESPRRKHWFLLIACGMLFCVGIMGCLATLWATAYYPTCAAMPFPFYTDIEKNAFFELPLSARNLEHNSRVSSRSCVIWVQFDIASADLEALQNSTLIKIFETKRIEDSGFLHFMEEQDWTQPANSIIGSGGIEGYTEDGYIKQWLLIDSTDATNLIVYIIVTKNWL